MSFSDIVLLEHMLEQCNRIAHALEKTTYDEYLSETIYQDAIVHALQILGEAAGNLSLEFTSTHPEIPISDIKGLRNILVHQYYHVDLVNVWNIAKDDVPELKKDITSIIKQMR